MQRNGDVMRSDRLKQVMQEIDSTFDEKNLGISKFSKFCLEASQKGLLHVTKLENGQLEVAPPRPGKGAREAPPASAPARPAAKSEAAGDGDVREGKSRRGRRGGRGRKRGEREEQPVATTEPAGGAFVDTVVESTVEEPVARPAPHVVVTSRDLETVPPAAAPEVPVTPIAARRTHRAAPHVSTSAPASDASIGLSGIRLTRDEAFSLVRDAVAALVSGDDAVPSERVRQKAFALLGRDSESLSERNFARILRDAHDAEAIDLRKRGDAFEVAAVTSVSSVADQLEVKEAAFKAVADRERAASTPPAPRGMGPRGAPARGGRGGFAAKTAAPPAHLLLLGVVDDAPPAEEEKPKRPRKPRAKKAVSDA
jgi:hypothetical protein